MVTGSAELSAVDYARSIVVSLYPILDQVEWRLPRPPEQCVWRGEAQSQYAAQLGSVRDTVAALRMHLDATLEALHVVSSCG